MSIGNTNFITLDSIAEIQDIVNGDYLFTVSDGVIYKLDFQNLILTADNVDFYSTIESLSAQVVRQLLERNKSIEPAQIEDFILGCAFPEGPQGMLMAKGVSILSGVPETAGGSVVNRFCGSSMDAVHQISTKIESGDIDVGIACGVEDMFSVPMGGFNPDFHPDLAEKDYYIGMGETAENLANEGKISRESQELVRYFKKLTRINVEIFIIRPNNFFIKHIIIFASKK